MRRFLPPLAALLAVATLWSCDETATECVDYCVAVSERLRGCGLQDDFDVTDCEDRVVDVEALVCQAATINLAVSECDDVAASFCFEEGFACPQPCFSECCADEQCPAERPHCSTGSCVECVTGADCSTQSCELGVCVACTVETQAVACGAGYACDYPNTCRQTCLEDDECGAYRACIGNVCSDPVGAACTDGFCGPGGFCEELDANAQLVPEYCTIYCYDQDPAPCPAGFTCLDGYCRP